MWNQRDWVCAFDTSLFGFLLIIFSWNWIEIYFYKKIKNEALKIIYKQNKLKTKRKSWSKQTLNLWEELPTSHSLIWSVFFICFHLIVILWPIQWRWRLRIVFGCMYVTQHPICHDPKVGLLENVMVHNSRVLGMHYLYKHTVYVAYAGLWCKLFHLQLTALQQMSSTTSNEAI